MGSRSSKNMAQNSSTGTWSPWQHRKALLRDIRLMFDKPEESEKIPVKIKELKEKFGIFEDERKKTKKAAGSVEEADFTLDQIGRQLVLDLEDALTSKKREWIKDSDWILHTLAIHVSPPIGRMTMPDRHSEGMISLQLNNTNLSNKNKEFDTILHIIRNNHATLQYVELAHTGVSVNQVKKLLPSLGKLPRLFYVGLKGNRLDKGILAILISILQDPKQFPRLIWVDLRNNEDIWSLPKAYTTELRKRWPKQGYQPTLKELAEGLVLVRDGSIELNV